MATYADNFTGTSGTDLSGRTMSGGGTWSKTGGTNAVTISAANAASVSAGTTAQRAFYAVPAGVSATAQYAKAVRLTNNFDAGPGVNLADAGSGVQGYFIRHNATTVAVRRIAAPTGTLTTIASFTNAGASTDVLELRRVDSSTLRAFRNGSQIGSDITDSTYTTGLPGIFHASTSASAGIMDDFEGGDLGGGGPTFQAAWARGSNIILGGGQ